MGLLLFVPGLILDLAGKSWFNGAQTVGVILMVTGAILIILQLCVLGATLSWISGSKRRRK